MRIIGEFDKGEIKVTVFQMNGKVSIKFEYNLIEQTYKFRDGSGIGTLGDAQNYCSESYMEVIQKIFQTMSESRSEALLGMSTAEGEEFEDII